MKTIGLNCYVIFLNVLCFVSFIAAFDLPAQEIFEVATAGDLVKVKELIKSEPVNINSKDEGGNTPLHIASRYGHTQIVKFLVNKGADVNSKNTYGYTPLLSACGGMNPDINLLKELIAKGADINAQLDRGLTALHFATMSGNIEIISFLIKNGVNLNIFDYGCYGTALHIALNLGKNKEVIKILLEGGAKLRDFSFGNTELHLAALKGYADLIELFIKHGADVNALNDYGHTPVYYAAKHGYQATVEELVKLGADKKFIEESNFGNAKQLKSRLKNDEAWLWYIGGLYGQGYAIKTKNHLLVFDQTEIDDSDEAGLANGNLNPSELKGQNITVLITKTHGLANKSQPFKIIEDLPDSKLIIDSDQFVEKLRNTGFSNYEIAVKDKTTSTKNLKVHTIPASSEGYGGARGVSYLVEVDGLRIYHTGFNASGYQESEREEFRKEIDKLKSYGPIDIAILTVGGHLTVAYLPYLYFIDQLSPKAIYLMGGDQVTEEYTNCINVLKDRNVPVFYPEAGIAMGERFHYNRN